MPNWERLRARLFQVVGERGQKAALAKKFGISAPAVSQWLSGKNVPTAEIALALLDWVATEEAKQNKNRRSAQTPRRRKTRSTESYEDTKERIRREE